MNRTKVALASMALTVSTAATGAPGAASDDPTIEPVAFSGHLSGGWSAEVGDETDVGDVTRYRGGAWELGRVEMSDPRLQGTVIHTHNIDEYPEVSIISSVWRFENEDGAWEGPEHTVILPDGERTASSVVLVGEGGYEGLIAVGEVTFVGFTDKFMRGVIVEGDVPPIPEAVTE